MVRGGEAFWGVFCARFGHFLGGAWAEMEGNI